MVRVWLVLAALVGLVQGALAAEGHIGGTVAFRDPGPIPADSVLEVLLADVTRGTDSVARVIGETTLAKPAGPPYAFDIAYDPDSIQTQGVYVLRAELSSGGKVLYRSRGLLPVLTRGAPSQATLWLARLPTPEDASTAALRLPAAFSGTMPCRDCKDVRYLLNLWPDRVFHLRRVWEGKDMRRDAVGRWSLDPAARRLVLEGGEDSLSFEIEAPDRLRLLPAEGKAQGDDRVLEAEPTFLPFDPHLALRGLVTWTENRASFAECTTGRQYPILEDGDYPLLEHAYLAAGVEPGMPLMASFDGDILQDAQSGTGAGEVRVERFVGVWSGETCASSANSATLRNTFWRILRLGESEVAALPNRREPSLILRDGERRFSATVGCNPITGRFTLSDGHLRFGTPNGPRLDCPTSLAALEDQLVAALNATVSWQITGQALSLFDDAGRRTALLQAVYLY